MEEQTPSETPQPKSSQKTIAITIIVLIVLAGGYLLYSTRKSAQQHAMTAKMATTPTMTQNSGEKGHVKEGMGTAPVTPPPLTDLQKKQLASGTATTTKEKTFNISGGNFYFTPDKITVNKGDKVTIIFDNKGGFHDFVIDAL